jgi:hypothetical protein
VPREKLAGEYCLERWPREFFVVGCSATARLRGRTDAGPLDGAVLKIGWDDRLIVAERISLFGGKVAWMILDTEAETLQGPFTDEEYARMRDLNPLLARVKVTDPGTAWRALHRSTTESP